MLIELFHEHHDQLNQEFVCIEEMVAAICKQRIDQ